MIIGESGDPRDRIANQRPITHRSVTGPEQHAATVREFFRYPDTPERAFAALDELVALAGRADELQRRLQSCEGNLDLSVQTGKLLVEQREAAEARADELQRGRDEARREADQLRAALEQIADRTYPAVYVGTTADGTKIYGGSDDAARFARAALAGVQADNKDSA